MKYKFSVITPVRNRENLLKRVGKSLNNQTFKNFEWLCGDDGSTDETMNVALELFKKYSLNGILVSFNKHIGKSITDNILLSSSTGDYILWCDSDDFFHNRALEIVNLIIENNVNSTYMPIIILPTDRIESFSKLNSIDINKNFNTLKNIVKIDKLKNAPKNKDWMMVIPRSYIENLSFPEVDFYIPEYSMLRHLQNLPTIFLDIVLKYGDYLPSGITKGNGMIKYPRGLWFESSLDIIYNKRCENTNNFRIFIKLSKNFRLAFLANIRSSVIFQLAKYLNINKIIFLFAIFSASIFYIKDILFKKIERTHISYDLNTQNFTSTHIVINNGQLINKSKISHNRITSFDDPIDFIRNFI